MPQVKPSDGATIPGIDAANAKTFVLELTWAAVRGELECARVATAVRAAALDPSTAASILADVLWLVWGGACVRSRVALDWSQGPYRLSSTGRAVGGERHVAARLNDRAVHPGLGSSLPGGVRLVTGTIPAVIN